MSRQVYRAAFARFTVTREIYAGSSAMVGSCDTCGGKNGKGDLYQYSVEHDGGRSNIIRGMFCSASCCKSYHGMGAKWGES